MRMSHVALSMMTLLFLGACDRIKPSLLKFSVPVFEVGNSNYVVSESVGSVQVKLRLPRAAGVPVSVPFQTSGTALKPEDYTLQSPAFIFAPGAIEASVVLQIVQDNLVEGTETVLIQVQPSAGVDLSSSGPIEVTINDDDVAPPVPPAVSFTSESQSIVESGGMVSLQLSLSGPWSQPVTVPLVVSGTAAASDTSMVQSPVVFPAGTTSASVSFTIVDDAVSEGNENLVLTIENPTNATLGSIPVHTLAIVDNDNPPEIRFASASSAPSESSGTVNLSVTLSNPSSVAVTVPYTVGGSASSAVDHTLSSGSLTIQPGMMAGSISFNLIDDALNEGDETVVVTLGVPTGGTLGSVFTHTLTIQDNDPLPQIQFAASALSVQENVGTLNLSVSLGAPSGRTVSFSYQVSGTASRPADHNLANGTGTISPGQTAFNIPVTIVNDALVEAPETLVVTLVSPVNAVIGTVNSQTVTIMDVSSALPVAQFQAASASVSEGTATATVTLSLNVASASAVSVPFSVGGAATPTLDYSVSASSFVFAPNSTTSSVTVNVANDTLDEANETVVFTLGSPANATLGASQAFTLTIQDNDAAPTVQWQIASQSASEAAGTVSIVGSLSAASGLPVSAIYTFGGTAVRNTDYTASGPSGTLSIPAGALTANVALPLINNTLYQGGRSVTLTLSAPVNASLGTNQVHTLSIADDESPPIVSFASASQTVTEAVGQVSVPVALSVASAVATSIPYTVTGTALNSSDHSLASGTLTIPGGSTSGLITFSVVNDSVAESSETIVIALGTPQNASLGSTVGHTVTINDDDAVVPVVQFASASQSISESAGTISVPVSLSAATTAQVSVPYTIGGSSLAPGDHNLTNATLIIPAGSTSGNIVISVVNDSIDESDETLVITLGSPAGATLGTGSTHTLTIQDNDSAPTVSWSVAGQTVSENVGTVSLTASLSTVSGLGVGVPYTVSGTAQSPADHNAASGVLTIPAGQQSASLSFQVVADGVAEGSETVVFTMSSPTFAALGSGSIHTVTISDSGSVPLKLSWNTPVQTVSEGQALTLTAKLNSPAPSAVTAQVVLSGSAAAGSDFLFNPSSISIPAGATSASISINALQDSVAEASEMAVFTLMNPSGGAVVEAGQGVFSLTISDGTSIPSVEWETPNVYVSESAGSVQIFAKLSAPSALPITVPYFFLSGPSGETAPGGTISIPPGILRAPFSFSIPNNSIVDSYGERQFVFYLANPTNAQVRTETSLRVYVSDDEIPVVGFEKISGAFSESSGTVFVKARLDKPLPGNVAVSLPVSVGTSVLLTGLGSASAGGDFSIPTQSFIFQPGSLESTLALTLVNDSVAEQSEMFMLYLDTYSPMLRSDSTRSRMNVTISDDDNSSLTLQWGIPPDFSASFAGPNGTQSAAIAVSELAGVIELVVYLNKPSSSAITVPIVVAGGTAVAGTNYILNTQSVTIPAGSTSAPVSVSIVNNTTFGDGGQITLGFGTVSGAVVSGVSQIQLRIKDDDPTPAVDLPSAVVTVAESTGNALVPVQLAAQSTVALTIQNTTEFRPPGYQGTGLKSSDDFNPNVTSARSVTIPAGSISGNFQVPIVNDTLSEDDEAAFFRISQFIHESNIYFVTSTKETVLVVSDNDPIPLVQWTLASQSKLESEGKAILTASMNVVAGKTIHIPFTLGGTAIQGSDYRFSASELIIPEGATSGDLEVPFIVDSIPESDKSIVVTLVSGGNANPGATFTHTVTLQDPLTIVPSLSAFQTTVYPLVRGAVCINCHVPGGSASFASFASGDLTEAFNAAVPRANFANIPQSLLATKLSAGHMGQQALYNSMITAITQWRDGSISPASPTPTPTSIVGTVGVQDFLQYASNLETSSEWSWTPPPFPTQSTYELSVSNLATQGLVSELSSPMIVAYLSVGSEYCKGMIEDVASSTSTNKRGFDQILGLSNFNIPNSSFTAAMQEQVVIRLATRFWQRQPTPQETVEIQTLVSDLKVELPNISTKDLGSAMCTAIAGAVEGIVQ